MRSVLGPLLFLALFCGTLADAVGPSNENARFGTGHIALLKNISDSLDASLDEKKVQHQKILEVSKGQHEEIMNERGRLYEELKEDRTRQFQEILETGDKQHSEFIILLQQIMKNIESTDAYKLGQVHMDLIEKITKSLTVTKNENAQHLAELKNTFQKQHSEIKNLKVQQAEQIKKDRNVQFEAIKKKQIQQEEEIKKMLQQVVAKLDQPKNCHELYKMGIKTDGVYLIKPEGFTENFYVYCDMTKDNGGWTVIQRRGDYGPEVDFRRNWADYKAGFGKLTGEHWLGNEKIYYLVRSKDFQLKIDMKNYQHVSSYITIPQFYIENESSNYLLRLGGSPVGQPAATMTTSNGWHFSTTDRANYCRQFNQYGPWWFKSDCGKSASLNGMRQNSRGMAYITFDGDTPLAEVTMKVKPANS